MDLRKPGTPPLAELMMSAARELANQPDLQTTFDTAVRLAVTEIDGADLAALTIVRQHRRHEVHSPAATHQDARDADAQQYELSEGPCLDATWEQRVVHSPDLATDARWPRWGPAVADDLGVHSLLAFRLFTDGDTLGALNLYARRAGAFDADDRDFGAALAAHIAVATRAAQQQAGLEAALESRTTIGVAIGIVMERFGIDQSTAFALLGRLSSSTETKLREVAAGIVETGAVPTTGDAGGAAPTS